MRNRQQKSVSVRSDDAELARLCSDAVHALATTSNPALLNAALERIDSLLAEARDELRFAVLQYQSLQQSALADSTPRDVYPEAQSSALRIQWG